MRDSVILLCLVLVLAACTSTTGLAPAVTSVNPCGDWQSIDTAPRCITNTSGILVQSGEAQSTIQAYDISLVVNGTAWIENTPGGLTISVLEGTTVVSVKGQTRVLRVAQQTTLPLIGGLAGFPSESRAILQRPQNIPLDSLPRPVDASAFVITPTPQPTDIPTPEPEACPRPDGWTATYTIISGDTLAAIANRLDITLENIASANCLTNIARIRVGQDLAVPLDATSSEQNVPARQIAIGFRADAYALQSGDCTVLRWDAFGASEIYLDDERVNESSSQDICLQETQSFTLRVILGNGQEESRELTISVSE